MIHWMCSKLARETRAAMAFEVVLVSLLWRLHIFKLLIQFFQLEHVYCNVYTYLSYWFSFFNSSMCLTEVYCSLLMSWVRVSCGFIWSISTSLQRQKIFKLSGRCQLKVINKPARLRRSMIHWICSTLTIKTSFQMILMFVSLNLRECNWLIQRFCYSPRACIWLPGLFR